MINSECKIDSKLLMANFEIHPSVKKERDLQQKEQTITLEQCFKES